MIKPAHMQMFQSVTFKMCRIKTLSCKLKAPYHLPLRLTNIHIVKVLITRIEKNSSFELSEIFTTVNNYVKSQIVCA